MKKLILAVSVLLISLASYTQNRFTLSGYVRDSVSGESLIGATVSISQRSNGNKTVSTNQYGYYSITLPEEVYTVTCTYVGYASMQQQVELQKNQYYNFLLPPKSTANTEVIVYARRKDQNVSNAQMGKIDLSVTQIKSIPAVFGEVDILKTLQLLPGVRNAGEGNAGFYVRGGGPDQNLIILDDAV